MAVALRQTQLGWVTLACRNKTMRATPIKSIHKVSQHVSDLTPEGERIANEALKALLCPIPLPMLMDEADAVDALKVVEDRVVTRDEKREAKVAERHARQEARNKEAGEARAAFRANVFAREVHTHISYDNVMRWHRS